MKTYSTSIACCLALLLSLAGCHKDDNNPTGNNNSGNTGGTIGTLKITGWSPERPYANEVITLTGTGFSPVDTANHVTLRWYYSGHKDLTVISATATRIEVMIAVGDSNNYAPLGWSDAFTIRVGTASYTHDKPITLHAPLRVRDVTTPAGFAYKGLIPDEQGQIEVQGFDPSEGGTLELLGAHNGNLPIDSIAYDEHFQISTIYCTPRANLMMNAPVPWQRWLCDSDWVKRTLVVHSNGRTASYLPPTGIMLLPPARADSIRPGAFSVEELNAISTNGGQAFVTIYGRNVFGIVSGEIVPEQPIENYSDRIPVQIGGLNWAVPKRGLYPVYLLSRWCSDTTTSKGIVIGSIHIY